MDLTSRVHRSARCRAAPEAVYALLADVPRSASHFPDLESLVPHGPDRWGWRLARLGAGPLVFQVVYVSDYRFDPEKLDIRWTPVTGLGNTRVGGAWRIHPDGAGSRFELSSDYVVSTPFPTLARRAAEAIMQRENERILGTYLDNLVRTLEGGDGTVRRAAR
jgi:hypothetical protein